MERVSRHGLVTLAEMLSERDRAVTETVARLRLVSGQQLGRLLFSEGENPATRARLARRSLARLTDLRVVTRLERRVGGVRAGSAGHVYALDVAGQRLVAYWQGEGIARSRSAFEPGTPFVRHTLALAEHYVRLVEAEREGAVELLSFSAEPECWRRFTGLGGAALTLKPDAFVSLGVGEFEERSFLEIDCGTEGRSALLRQCRGYLDYFRSGAEQAASGVFPRVVWITTTERRVGLLTEVCAALPPEAWQLFVVGRPERALSLLSGRGPTMGGRS